MTACKCHCSSCTEGRIAMRAYGMTSTKGLIITHVIAIIIYIPFAYWIIKKGS